MQVELTGKTEKLIHKQLAAGLFSSPEQVIAAAMEQFKAHAVEYAKHKPNRQEEVPAETLYEVAKRVGLIGCGRGRPPDLSTNPQHMEGFGSL